MKECNCETVKLSEVEQTEERSLLHKVCGRIFDPALILIRENRNTPAAPHMPNVEYRGELGDGT